MRDRALWYVLIRSGKLLRMRYLTACCGLLLTITNIAGSDNFYRERHRKHLPRRPMIPASPILESVVAVPPFTWATAGP